MFLIAGLGNPSEKYKNNRHNIGFMIIDEIIKSISTTQIKKAQFRGELYKSGETLFLKPLTYMNLSGESIISVINYYKIDDLIVIHDDLDLPFGAIRFKKGGGNGGHNGLKSIDKDYKKEYIKVRVGIGKPKEQDISSYVLSNFSEEEKKCLNMIIERVKDATLKLVTTPLEKVSSLYSSKKSLCSESL